MKVNIHTSSHAFYRYHLIIFTVFAGMISFFPTNAVSLSLSLHFYFLNEIRCSKWQLIIATISEWSIPFPFPESKFYNQTIFLGLIFKHMSVCSLFGIFLLGWFISKYLVVYCLPSFLGLIFKQMSICSLLRIFFGLILKQISVCSLFTIFFVVDS